MNNPLSLQSILYINNPMITAISANDIISVCSVIKEELVHRNRFSIETLLPLYIRVSNNTNYQRRNLNVSANR